MNRRAFLASLPFIPAGVKAALAAPKRTFMIPRTYEATDEQIMDTVESLCRGDKWTTVTVKDGDTKFEGTTRG